MYISEIRIRNYKNFYKSSISLKNNINTIIGENGSGKTNLFYAIRQLMDKTNRHYLCEDDFSYQLSDIKGHWIIISAIFSDVPDSEDNPEAVGFNADDSGKSIYTLFFRPNKIVRNKLYQLSQELENITEIDDKVVKKMEIYEYLSNINVNTDYEVVKKVGQTFDFIDDNEYSRVIGNFVDCLFPSPDDVQDDAIIVGNNADSNLNEFINITFIPAIRDVNGELVRDGNFFEKMLNSISETIGETQWAEIKEDFANINAKLREIDKYNSFAHEILTTMKNTVGATFSSDMFLDVTIPEEKANIVKYFTLKGKIEDHNINLYNKSLGENNVIYFALKMLQNNYQSGHTRKLYNLLIIEEPEAHLHKHLQQTFFAGIGNNLNFQILLSTHSVHVSEASKVSSMIVLGKQNEKSNEIYNPSLNLSNDEIRYLERYLDATRSPILFSKNVILVEGDAELIFITNILKLKYGFDLNAYGISLISMDNCFFEKISLLFDKCRLRKKCSILTDLDGDFDGSNRRISELSLERVSKLNVLHYHNDYVNIYANNYTFEIELYSNNLEILTQYVIDRKIYTRDVQKIIGELNSEQVKDVKFKRILLIAEKLGKGWFALDFIDWLSAHEEYIKDFKIPDYIIGGLKNFFPSETYEKDIYKQIVTNYCKKNDIDESSIDDDFVIYIRKLYNEE